jgi:hypothetical protein
MNKLMHIYLSIQLSLTITLDATILMFLFQINLEHFAALICCIILQTFHSHKCKTIAFRILSIDKEVVLSYILLTIIQL